MAAKKKVTKRKAIDESTLLPAGGSGDGRVQYLIAERTALTSGAPGGFSEAVVREKVDAIDAELAELGFTAK